MLYSDRPATSDLEQNLIKEVFPKVIYQGSSRLVFLVVQYNLTSFCMAISKNVGVWQFHTGFIFQTGKLHPGLKNDANVQSMSSNKMPHAFRPDLYL